MKKILSLLLALCLLAACLPFSASAAVESYHVFVGSVEVTSANASGVTGTNISGKVTYDPASRTLSLENATVNGKMNDGVTSGAAIFANGDLKIKTTGANTVHGGSFEKQSYGIVSIESLTFEGAGSLKITVPEEDYITTIATKNGSVTVNSGTVEAVTGDGTYLSIALHSGNGVIVNGGTLTATGGETYETYGIYSAKKGVKVYGGTVTASAGSFGKSSYGIYCSGDNDLVVSGGTVTAFSPYHASNRAPDVSGYPGELVEASTSESGTPLVDPYLAANISDYKYLKISRAPIVFEEVEITGLDAPAVGKSLDTSLTVPEGVAVVSVSWSPSDTAAKANTSYTVTVELKTESGCSFASGAAVNFNGLAGTVLSVETNLVKASFTFPETHEEGDSAFTDVPAGAYYAKAVKWAVGKEITSGLGDGLFGPGKSCTRAQAVTFLWNAAGKPAPTITENPFADVKESAYYYNAVLWAVEKGITKGTDATAFSPNKTCTRGQIVTFLWNKADKPDISTPNPFADVKESAYYYNAVLWAVEKGVTNGTGATAFSPNKTCTRSQIVTFLWNDEGKPE